MLPGDGLPMQVCCMCAEKLESAYEFKLQVEQADNVLREKFLTMSLKEELFFNEVEVHLDVERNDSIEINVGDDYESTATVLSEQTENDKNLLKDQLMLLHVEKLTDTEEIQQGKQYTTSKLIINFHHW